MTSWFLVQFELFICILSKIRCFDNWRNSLARIITKFSAGGSVLYNTFLGAEQGVFRQIRGKQTSSTGTGCFLSEQHDESSRYIVTPLYMMISHNSTFIFAIFSGKQNCCDTYERKEQMISKGKRCMMKQQWCSNQTEKNAYSSLYNFTRNIQPQPQFLSYRCRL